MPIYSYFIFLFIFFCNPPNKFNLYRPLCISLTGLNSMQIEFHRLYILLSSPASPLFSSSYGQRTASRNVLEPRHQSFRRLLLTKPNAISASKCSVNLLTSLLVSNKGVLKMSLTRLATVLMEYCFLCYSITLTFKIVWFTEADGFMFCQAKPLSLLHLAI